MGAGAGGMPSEYVSRSSGYHSIGLAELVIVQAWEDAFETSPDRLWINEVHEAWAFLTARGGKWARAREDWCIMAGLCPDKLRTRALMRMNDHERQCNIVTEATKRKSAYSRKYKMAAYERQRAAA